MGRSNVLRSPVSPSSAMNPCRSAVTIIPLWAKKQVTVPNSHDPAEKAKQHTQSLISGIYISAKLRSKLCMILPRRCSSWTRFDPRSFSGVLFLGFILTPHRLFVSGTLRGLTIAIIVLTF